VVADDVASSLDADEKILRARRGRQRQKRCDREHTRAHED
jgi:hypothetical protein